MVFEKKLDNIPGYIETEDEEGNPILFEAPSTTLKKSQNFNQEIQRQNSNDLFIENTQLKAQIKAQAETQAFQEECLVEMASIVYA